MASVITSGEEMLCVALNILPHDTKRKDILNKLRVGSPHWLKMQSSRLDAIDMPAVLNIPSAGASAELVDWKLNPTASKPSYHAYGRDHEENALEIHNKFTKVI